MEAFKEAEKRKLVVVLDNVRSLHNVGSVFRTADAFRLEAVYLCGITGTPPHPDIHKTALGAEEAVTWRHFPDTLQAVSELCAQGYQVLAVEQAHGATFLNELHIAPGKAYAVVLGNEVKGVSQEVVDACEGCIEIPQCGTKHSMNVSVTAGIVMWEFFKHL